jgi:HSP20 family protein
MSIIRFDPFALQRQYFQPLWDNDEWPELTMTEGLNVYEEAGNVIVEASVPGIPEEKLDITYEDGVLRIAGKSENTEEEKKKNRVVHKMQRVSSFEYSTYLPRPINEAKIEAAVKNGVLTVTAPIAEAAKPKRIAVKTHSK